MDFRLISFERGKSDRRPCVKFAGMSCAHWGSVGHFGATGAH